MEERTHRQITINWSFSATSAIGKLIFVNYWEKEFVIMSKQLTGRLRQINKLLTVSSVNAASTHNNLFTYVNELSHAIPNVEPPIVSPEEAVACIQSGKRTGVGKRQRMQIDPYAILFCYVRFCPTYPLLLLSLVAALKAEWKCDQVEVTMCLKGNKGRGGESRKFLSVCVYVCERV